ncbi:mitochondrial import receptor subunit TOM9-1-like [Lycium ferocissimum]|uniref:mitochondrial import receptor subunit TOM9-1-like n=1 Tax=Lycium ferocissimum TaxID=112874 RepID=UPI002815677F|nr:mitochondrial import receptor subunit TOM9-1-like [Lycium ferocissimum]
MASVGGKRFSLTGSTNNNKDEGVLSKISRSSIVTKGKEAACGATYVGKKLAKSTGKAAWLVATTVLVLGLPLMIVMDREQQLNELDLQQASLLGAPPASVVVPQK